MRVSRSGWIVLALSFAGSAGTAQLAPVPAWFQESNQANAGFGSSVSGAGDVNGDGFGDVLVCAFAFTDDQFREGRAYLFLGSREGTRKLPSWTIESDQAYATLGPAEGVGDVNGDGYDDVVVGNYLYTNDVYLEGRAMLFLGSAGGLAQTPAWSVEGDALNVNLGGVVAPAGDVNGDGFDDVFIGVGQYSNGQQAEGQGLVYLGSAAGLAPTPVWSAEGNQRFCGFGNGRSAGDVNDDGYDDLIVGASSFNNGELDEGRAYLYLGSPAGPSPAPDWSAEGNQEDAAFGSSVGAAGDVNGDGFGDVIVGAYGYDTPPITRSGEGRAYVYLGSATGLGATPAWSAGGTQETELFGVAAAAGDLDGDGFSDVIIGATGFDHGEREEGRACVYFGSSRGLALRPGWSFEGNQRFAAFGWPLACAGDVNGDGFSDVIVGANLYDHGQHDEGGAWVFLGASRLRQR